MVPKTVQMERLKKFPQQEHSDYFCLLRFYRAVKTRSEVSDEVSVVEAAAGHRRVEYEWS